LRGWHPNHQEEIKMSRELYERAYGVSYKEDMSNKEITKEIRGWVKKRFPEFKWSVTLGAGNSINCDMIECPSDFRFVEFSDSPSHYNGFKNCEGYQAIMCEIKAFGNSFNYDGSDIMTDYFDVNFYFFPNVKWNSPAGKIRDEQQDYCKAYKADY
jgi:hypothetical protein